MSAILTENSSAVREEFFKKLAFLFYGIASCEEPIDADGFDLLKKQVQKIWQKRGSQLEGFEGVMANKVEAMFDWINLNETDWEYCLQEFGYFANKNAAFLTGYNAQFVQESALEITRIFGGEQNKAFLKLQQILNP
ncbi:MAG: hypothetical protein IT244_09650 [Bacteroidia bacterium]|nr:hypothetical protein [Bacteroidia bacterium]